MYGLYHMTNPQVFYNREDLWTVASDIGPTDRPEKTTQPMEPNFLLMKLPGEKNEEFVEMLPFTPANRNNLIGWIAGRSDPDHYGDVIVYDFPKTRLVDGPLQLHGTKFGSIGCVVCSVPVESVRRPTPQSTGPRGCRTPADWSCDTGRTRPPAARAAVSG